VGALNTSTLAYTDDSLSWAADVLRSAPGQYARFVEYTENTGRVLDDDRMDDTGVTVRALLPITASDERQSLRVYTGPAIVFDHRVICYVLDITLLSLNAPNNVTSHRSIRGVLNLRDGNPPPLFQRESMRQSKVLCNCVWTVTPGQYITEPKLPGEISICHLDPQLSGLVFIRPGSTRPF
jgi:hypothetical protein